ncbi:hypothetical protein P872_17925 [Rhodonellum psychrophilum GCM71 = DSM 17998]|uniref:SGNH hydrolase-type esterase domain-containing protein n=2 Tax=Rhodonellum TaxID=336827 RepID=U5BY59_9BACT|nr:MULTISPECIES: GDSL-type esterase/lipase family protein [Rhodonellum]ERM82504.1 hypothetical protein P872_17925 [Rhodonellum psychrophilum GCM71 = DSM 17998]MDO9553649.1 GDSL-type esterase/lipase family protein [Rhodonellum sp.]SDY68301.1 Lysophospholipase L1 [Rhodonellum ikkaensis]
MKKSFLGLFMILISAGFSFSQSQIKVACIGNSITQGPGRDNPESYPLQMQTILGDKYDVRNFGVSGRTLLKNGDFPYWNEPQYQEVLAYTPDIVVIKLGTNDSKPQNWKYAKEFKQDYLDLISSVKASMPEDGKIYICLPVPVFQTNYGITENIIREEMLPILLDISKETGIEIIDLHSPFEGKSDLLADGVHPNTEGLGIMAKVVAEKIKK